MKKGVFFGAFILLVASISFASAAFYSGFAYGISEFVQDFIDGFLAFVTPFFEVIIGDYSTSEFFLTKALFLVLLFVVITASLRRIPTIGKNKLVVNVIAAVIAVIAVRFVSEEGLIAGLLLPYGALGIILLTVIPFVIIFVALHFSGAPSFVRRIVLVFVFIVIIVLLIYYSERIPTALGWIYWLIIIIALIVIIFDRGVHEYFAMWEINKFYTGANHKTIAALQAEYLHIADVDTPQANARKAAIRAHLKGLGANVP